MLPTTKLGSPASDLAFIKILDDNAVSTIPISQRVLRFHYMPDSISESKTANWDNVDILGRSEPIRFYGSSQTRMLDLKLMFHVKSSHEDDVEVNVRFLRSLVYPDYSDSSRATFSPLPPPVVVLKIGDWLSMRSIVTNVSVERFGPWEQDSLFANRAEVSIKFEEYNVRPPDAGDVFFGDDMIDAPIQVSSAGDVASSNEDDPDENLFTKVKDNVVNATSSAVSGAITTVGKLFV